MKCLLDANLPERLVSIIQGRYDADCKKDQGHLSDKEIYEICKKEGRVLLTLDTDFSNRLLYPPHQHPGIVVFRLSRQSLKQVTLAVLNFFETFKNQWNLLEGSLVTIREDRFRIYRD